MERSIVFRASLFAVTVLVLALLPSVCVFASWDVNGNPICTAVGDQYPPTITSDGAGGAIITWYDYRSGTADIYVQRVNASGVVQWTTDGLAICTAAGYQTYPTIVSDGAGGAIITWHDQRSGTWDIYAQRVNASGAIQWTADGVALCTAADIQLNPTIISDGGGGAIVTWNDYRSGSYSDIYAQRVNASGAVQWTANGVALCIATGHQYSPIIISDGGGGAIVTWTDRRSGTNYDIYAQRVNASGAVQWTANGVALCTATGDQTNPTIVSDGAGGTIVTWTDYRSGSNNDIYAQRVNASGTIQWTANGVPVSAGAGEQRYSTIASDGAGGAIITWHDNRGGNYDICAQRVNASGAVQWITNGIALCVAAGDQNYPMIMSDGAGGAIVTWNDGRNGASDIYAQRVNGSGAVQWTTDGVAISTATDYQQYPQMASDGAGGAIVTWDDERSGNWDIYAGRIQATGTTDVPYAGAAMSALGQNYPNPFNPATLITFSVRAPGEVKLRIYDVAGRVLRTLVDGWRGAGEYWVMWDGKRDDGTAVASGVYFYRLKTSGFTATRKMVLLR